MISIYLKFNVFLNYFLFLHSLFSVFIPASFRPFSLSDSNAINQDRFPTLRIAQASFRFLIFSPQKPPSTRKQHTSFQREMDGVLPLSSLHLQFSFSFRDAVTLSQIEIFPVWKMFSFARKSLDLFANEEELKRRPVISLFETRTGFVNAFFFFFLFFQLGGVFVLGEGVWFFGFVFLFSSLVSVSRAYWNIPCFRWILRVCILPV